MKLLKILGGNDGGGIYECEKQFINYWRKKNIEVHAIIVGAGIASLHYKGMVDKFFILPKIKLISKGKTPLKELRNIAIVRKYNISVKSVIDNIDLAEYSAIIYQRHFYTGIASYISKCTKVNAYWHMPLSVRSGFEKKYFRYLANKNNINVIANSKHTKHSIGDISEYYVYPGFNEKRVVSHNTSPYYRIKLSIPENNLVFGIAARINQRKAVHTVIESFIKLSQEYEEIHLMIAGGPLDTEYAKKCISMAEESKNKVHFLGKLEKMAEFYASINVYVHSIMDVEAFGISVAESLGSGLPVIAYSNGGPKEMVIQNYNGWLVNKPNVLEYYQAMKKAVLSRDSIKEMGLNSKKMSKEFRADINAEKFLDIIKIK